MTFKYQCTYLINILEWLTYNLQYYNMTQLLLSYYFFVTFVNNFILLLFWKTCLETDYTVKLPVLSNTIVEYFSLTWSLLN